MNFLLVLLIFQSICILGFIYYFVKIIRIKESFDLLITKFMTEAGENIYKNEAIIKVFNNNLISLSESIKLSKSTSFDFNRDIKKMTGLIQNLNKNIQFLSVKSGSSFNK